MDSELKPPQAQTHYVGREDVEKRLRQTLADGALSHGWIIAGGQGAGKATLAYRAARALLDPTALKDGDTLDMREEARVFHLVAAGAHPDLFIAEREWDEKKARRKTEISIETIRKLTSFMSRTASFGGARVAIVDTADDLNRSAANALLKVLEEPPANTALFLLSEAPGRLLATIRSRCRKIDLPPVAQHEIEALLIAHGAAPKDASVIAGYARGRPGFGLQLAESGGAAAISLAQSFVTGVTRGADVGGLIRQLSGKSGDDLWPIFCDAMLDGLSDEARMRARVGDEAAGRYLQSWEIASTLIRRGDGLNVDRGQLALALAHDLKAALTGRAA